MSTATPHPDSPIWGPGAAEARANSAFFRVMETAPLGLLISAALGLAIVGVFQYIFYLLILPGGWSAMLRAILSGSLAVFFEALGFYFLVATVRDFSAGHRREGYIGLLATFLLWGYALWEATHIAAAFDANTPETWWSIFGIIGTIVCVVRVVELRITLTVTSAYRRNNEMAAISAAAEAQRKTIETLTGKLALYEAESARIEAEKAEAEKTAARLAEEARDAQIAPAFAELDRLRKSAARAERTGHPHPIDRNKRAEIERKVRKFYKENGMPPTQAQAATIAGLSDPRALRHLSPNGAWEGFIETLKPETTPA